MKKNEEENICSEYVESRYCKSMFHLNVKVFCVNYVNMIENESRIKVIMESNYVLTLHRIVQ